MDDEEEEVDTVQHSNLHIHTYICIAYNLTEFYKFYYVLRCLKSLWLKLLGEWAV